jgi:hypothetical protein
MKLFNRLPQLRSNRVIARTFESAVLSNENLQRTRTVDDGQEFEFRIFQSEPAADAKLIDAALNAPCRLPLVRMTVRPIDEFSLLLKIVTEEPEHFQDVLGSGLVELELEYVLLSGSSRALVANA